MGANYTKGFNLSIARTFLSIIFVVKSQPSTGITHEVMSSNSDDDDPLYLSLFEEEAGFLAT